MTGRSSVRISSNGIAVLVLGLIMVSLFATAQRPSTTATKKRISLVDPFLGTGGHGHVYPGATVPFGMVQLSPDNGVEGWDWCSGYHYSSNTIAGFSHTHLSGTGIGDGYDISVLPLADTIGSTKDRILVPFSHQNESATPGHYRVKLDNGVDCEFTTTTRTGFHRYRFPNKQGWLRWDPGFNINWDVTDSAEIQIMDAYTIAGYKHSTGWAKNQRVYFTAKFNKKIEQYQFIAEEKKTGLEKSWGKKVKLLLLFHTSEPLEVRVGISNTSAAAAANAMSEIRHRSFLQVKADAENAWEKELSKIRIETDDEAMAKRFYTSLYRTCMAPVLFSDADGYYRNSDGRILKMKGGNDKYTIFSTWDTFRALHPLFTFTQQQRLPDLMNSMLKFYLDNGMLPVWDIASWEANTMTGFHAVPILADAILKDTKGFDHELAYEAMTRSSVQQHRGTPEYNRYGYIPQDKHGWSVTFTLEYAFDNWAIAQVAKKLGRMDDHALYMKKAMYYKNLFDSKTGFMRAKDTAGKFIEPFDPLLSEHGFEGQYIEGTAWQHSFFVPHDIEGMAALYGGKDKLAAKLDTLFTSPSELHGENVSADVTGLIGQYAHGNEPSHHIAYMYSALGYPDKAAKWLRVVADSMYKNGPDGLSGNDDCGQMSAWYIFTSLGFYPMNPVGGEYVFGYPLIKKATIDLGNSKTLTIKVTGKGEKISAVYFNRIKKDIRSIRHKELMQGGMLEIIL